MTLLDEALAMVCSFVPAETEAERSRLMAFCKAAELELVSGLREDVSEEDCAEALVCAVAWLALSYLSAGRVLDAERFSVGDLTVQRAADSKAAAECLRTQAFLLLAPYARETNFGFRGVPG